MRLPSRSLALAVLLPAACAGGSERAEDRSPSATDAELGHLLTQRVALLIEHVASLEPLLHAGRISDRELLAARVELVDARIAALEAGRGQTAAADLDALLAERIAIHERYLADVRALYESGKAGDFEVRQAQIVALTARIDARKRRLAASAR